MKALQIGSALFALGLCTTGAFAQAVVSETTTTPVAPVATERTTTTTVPSASQTTTTTTAPAVTSESSSTTVTTDRPVSKHEEKKALKREYHAEKEAIEHGR